MSRCIRCGEYFNNSAIKDAKICTSCEEVKADTFKVCNVCEELIDAKNILNGLCPACRSDNFFIEDEEDLEEELEDEIYDS